MRNFVSRDPLSIVKSGLLFCSDSHKQELLERLGALAQVSDGGRGHPQGVKGGEQIVGERHFIRSWIHWS
jgi:hypothetical protein